MVSTPYHTPSANFGILFFFMVGLLFGCGSGDSGFVPEITETNTIHFSDDWPEAGTAEALCSLPAAAQAMDSSISDQIIGNGTPESCSSAAVVAAVAGGGVIVFNCGPDPVTMTFTETAKVFIDSGPEIVIEGGGSIFFVSNDLSGTLRIDRSFLSNNPSFSFENVPVIFVLAGEIEYTDSVIE